MSLFNKLLSIFLSLFIFSIYFHGISLAQSSTEWLVESKTAKCFLQNIEKYKNSPTDPVIIYLDACPEVDLVKVFEQLSRNSAVPQINSAKRPKGSPEKVIVYRKEELTCLAKLSLSSEKDLIKLPKKPCS